MRNLKPERKQNKKYSIILRPITTGSECILLMITHHRWSMKELIKQLKKVSVKRLTLHYT